MVNIATMGMFSPQYGGEGENIISGGVILRKDCVSKKRLKIKVKSITSKKLRKTKFLFSFEYNGRR